MFCSFFNNNQILCTCKTPAVNMNIRCLSMGNIFELANRCKKKLRLFIEITKNYIHNLFFTGFKLAGLLLNLKRKTWWCVKMLVH